MTKLIGKNGRSYELTALINRVEYGEESIEALTDRLGMEVAAIVKEHVHARSRQFRGYFVHETEAAWVLRLEEGGDHWLPKRTTTIESYDELTGSVVVRISPSLTAEIQSQFEKRNLVYYSTSDVAKICGVSVDTVRKWIKRDLLPADSVGGMTYQYRIHEPDLQNFLQAHKSSSGTETVQIFPAKRKAKLPKSPTGCLALFLLLIFIPIIAIGLSFN